MTWKRFTALAFSMVLLLPFEQWVHACGGDIDPYDSYPSFFANDINPDPAFTPFRYTEYLPYYTEWYHYEQQPQDAVPDANIAEWYAYCGKTVPKADIDSFVYRYSYSELSSIYHNIDKGSPLQVPPVVQRNAFTQWFQKNKDLEALGYLMHAKKCEPMSAISYESWEPAQRDTSGAARLIKNGLQLHKAAQKEFFRWRYAYQIIRIAFYSGRYGQTLDLFNELIGDKTANNVMYPRILSLKAGALYKSGHKAEAAYLYSRVFDLTDESKESTHISYQWSTDSLSDEDVLKFCKNNHEKAGVYLMDGLYRTEGEDGALALMQAAYAADPAIRGLDILMTREINYLEQNFMTDDLTRSYTGKAPVWGWGQGYVPLNEERNQQWDSLRTANYRHIDSLNVFVQKVAEEGQNGRQSYWWLASSYLYFLKHDAANSERYLSKAEQGNLMPGEKNVADVIRALYILRADGKVTAATEARLLPRLKAMQVRAAGQDRTATKSFVDFMTVPLAQAYFAQNDNIKAIYVLAVASDNRVDNSFMDWPGTLLESMDPAGIEQVKAFYNKSSKTDFEKWLTTGNAYSNERLNELEATLYLRRQEFGKALELLKTVPESLLREIPLPDPFLAHFRDEQELGAADTAHWSDKRSFAQHMTELEARMQRNPKDGEAAFEYATGLYNMSYYGKAHNIYTYYRSSTDDKGYYLHPGLNAAEKEFYGVYQAEQYYLKALANYTDPESKAKCLFLAAKCWQKRCNLGTEKDSWERSGSDDYYVYSLGNPYFKQLREGYAGTRTFRQLTASCSYLQDYLKKK